MSTNVANTMTFPDGIWLDKAIADNANIAYTKLAQRTFAPIAIDLSNVRVHDDIRSFLPDEAATDDLGFEATATFGTSVPVIDSGDGASTTIQRYGRFQVQLPPEYEADETVQLRARVAMGTVSDTTATVDFSAYAIGTKGAVSGSDLVTTAATSCNSATAANYDFTLTDTSLEPGDTLDCRIVIDITDGATGSGVIAYIEGIWLLCDTRG